MRRIAAMAETYDGEFAHVSTSLQINRAHET